MVESQYNTEQLLVALACMALVLGYVIECVPLHALPSQVGDAHMVETGQERDAAQGDEGDRWGAAAGWQSQQDRHGKLCCVGPSHRVSCMHNRNLAMV